MEDESAGHWFCPAVNLCLNQTDGYRYCSFVHVSFLHKGNCYQHSPAAKWWADSWINPLFITHHLPLNLSVEQSVERQAWDGQRLSHKLMLWMLLMSPVLSSEGNDFLRKRPFLYLRTFRPPGKPTDPLAANRLNPAVTSGEEPQCVSCDKLRTGRDGFLKGWKRSHRGNSPEDVVALKGSPSCRQRFGRFQETFNFHWTWRRAMETQHGERRP